MIKYLVKGAVYDSLSQNSDWRWSNWRMWGWWNGLLNDHRDWKRRRQNRRSRSSNKRFSREFSQKVYGLAQTILHCRIESGNVEAALELSKEIRHDGPEERDKQIFIRRIKENGVDSNLLGKTF